MADPKLYRAIAPILTRKAVKPRPSGIAEVGDRLLLTDEEAKVMAGQIALDEPAPVLTSDPNPVIEVLPDEVESVPVQVPTEKILTREQREAELLAIYQPEGSEGRKDWAAIKAIAAERGITDRPERGWDDAIPLILEKEGY